MSSLTPTFTPVEFIKYKYEYRSYILEKYPNWENSESKIDYLYNLVDDMDCSYTTKNEFFNQKYYSNLSDTIKLVRIEYDRQINEWFQFDKNHYPTFDFKQYKTKFESTSHIDYTLFDIKDERLQKYIYTMNSKVTFRALKDKMDRDEIIIKEENMKLNKNLLMLDLWRQQYSAYLEKKKIENKLKIKKKWQNMFPKIVRKNIMKSVMNAITTVQHNLKHITQNKISPEKIARWSIETAHILALVEEKIKVVEQVMKWKEIAEKFHNQNCGEDHYGCCGGRSEPNFYVCHADCEYRKYYFMIN